MWAGTGTKDGCAAGLLVTWDVFFPNAGATSPLTLQPRDGSAQGGSGWRGSYRPVHSTVHSGDLPQLLCGCPLRAVQPQHNQRCCSWDADPSHLPRYVQPSVALPMAPHAAECLYAAEHRGSGGSAMTCAPHLSHLLHTGMYASAPCTAALCMSDFFPCRHSNPCAEAVVQRDLLLPFCHQQLSRGIGGWHSPGLWVSMASGAAVGMFVLCDGAGREVFLDGVQGYSLHGRSTYYHIPRTVHCSCSGRMHFQAKLPQRCAQRNHPRLASTSCLLVTDVFLLSSTSCCQQCCSP